MKARTGVSSPFSPPLARRSTNLLPCLVVVFLLAPTLYSWYRVSVSPRRSTFYQISITTVQQHRATPAAARQLPHTYLAVVAMFKNEAHILREWLEHYIVQGVEHFVLINNNSSDPYDLVLEPFISAGLVTLVSTTRTHYQLAATLRYFRKYLKLTSTWVLPIDLDEFMYAPGNTSTIASVLRQLDAQHADNDLAQVCVHWHTFGSSGYRKQPACVLQSFTKKSATPEKMTKCVVKSQRVVKLLLHHHVAKGVSVCADGSPELSEKVGIADCRSARGQELLRLNHYPLQAEDYFMEVKATRGDATSANLDNERTAEYFAKYDEVYNKVEDFELAGLQQQQNVSCSSGGPLTAPRGYHDVLSAAWEASSLPRQ
jgi:hypothetical protein